MSAYDYIQLAKEHGTITIAVLIALATLVQISPIKIDPWTWFGKWLSKIFTGDLSTKVDEINKTITDIKSANLPEKVADISKKLDQHIKESDERDLRKRRESILDFASAIAANKRMYSKEQYEQMLHECDEYLMYCEQKEFKNAVAEESIGLIRDLYSKRLADNSLLSIEDADKTYH